MWFYIWVDVAELGVNNGGLAVPLGQPISSCS